MIEKINIYSTPKEVIADGISCCVAFGNNMSFACFVKQDNGEIPIKDAPYFSHTEEQATMLLKGRARFWVGNESIDLEPGDMFFLPPNLKHRSEILEGPATFLFFYQPPMDARTEHQHIVTDDNQT